MSAEAGPIDALPDAEAAESTVTPRDEPREIELKYAVHNPDAVRRWLETSLPEGIEAGSWKNRSDEDAYVDTVDRILAASGFGARLRRRGSRVTLTLKSASPAVRVESAAGDGETPGPDASDALHRRIEVEGPATRSLESGSWPESEARDLLESMTRGRPLRVRFVIQQRRAIQKLRHEGDTAEVSLDSVRIRHRDEIVASFTTLEIEAVGESEPLLHHLAAAIESTSLVEPEPRSKEQIAAALIEGGDDDSSIAADDHEWGEERVAVRVEGGEAGGKTPAMPGATVADMKLQRTAGVRPEDTLGMAGRRVLRMHLARMLASEDGTRSGAVAEDLHKMRVATRRMRAAWRVFDGAYDRRLQRRYVSELRDVAGALGEVRDLDVQLGGLDSYIENLPAASARAMTPLADDWRSHRDAARARLIRLLDSKAYTRFVDDYRAFVEHPREGESETLPGAPVLVRDTAGGRIWIAYEHVRAHDITLAWADAPALHALRIDAKRLRYALEFFREVLPDTMDAAIERVTELQDHLGMFNDADIASRTTRAFLVAGASRLPAPSREQIGHYLESREAEIVRLRRAFPPYWRRLSGPTFRRRLALAIASL